VSTGFNTFDATIHQANTWLKEIGERMYWEDDSRPYLALRATLHAIRDHLVVDESAQLAAQLPLIIRGTYYEGWNPSKVPVRERKLEQFLDRIREDFERADPTIDPEQVARVVISVIGSKVSQGEWEQVMGAMPEEVQALWKTPAA
jgi:uncharacterized protein (DUF2267 family)